MGNEKDPTEGLGIELECKLLDAGSHDAPSRFSVTLKRGGASYTTEYWQGSAHRQWKSHLGLARHELAQMAKPDAFGPIRAGAPVGWYGGKLSVLLAEWFDRYTEPTTPELVDVLYCLVSDASGVRHGQGFEEFRSDFGYDTDSRKAEKAFNGCRDEWAGLVRLGLDLDELDRRFQDF